MAFTQQPVGLVKVPFTTGSAGGEQVQVRASGPRPNAKAIVKMLTRLGTVIAIQSGLSRVGVISGPHEGAGRAQQHKNYSQSEQQASLPSRYARKTWRRGDGLIGRRVGSGLGLRLWHLPGFQVQLHLAPLSAVSCLRCSRAWPNSPIRWEH